MSGQHHTLAALHRWEWIPGTHWIRGWVGLRHGLDTEARGQIIILCRGSNTNRQSVFRHYTDWAVPPLLASLDWGKLYMCWSVQCALDGSAASDAYWANTRWPDWPSGNALSEPTTPLLQTRNSCMHPRPSLSSMWPGVLCSSLGSADWSGKLMKKLSGTKSDAVVVNKIGIFPFYIKQCNMNSIFIVLPQ
jgi:hypothetical protein